MAKQVGRAFYPHRCAEALAAALGAPLIELPGNHAALINPPGRIRRGPRTAPALTPARQRLSRPVAPAFFAPLSASSLEAG